jgi:hypothetical protein
VKEKRIKKYLSIHKGTVSSFPLQKDESPTFIIIKLKKKAIEVDLLLKLSN